MPVSRATGLAWLAGEFSSHLAPVFETMAGERPSIGQTSTGQASTGQTTSGQTPTVAQALGAVAQAISARVGREVTPAGEEKNPGPAGDAGWIAIELTFVSGATTIFLGPEAALIEGLVPAADDSPVRPRAPDSISTGGCRPSGCCGAARTSGMCAPL